MAPLTGGRDGGNSYFRQHESIDMHTDAQGNNLTTESAEAAALFSQAITDFMDYRTTPSARLKEALEKDPENRFNSAEAMANALQRSLNLDVTPERSMERIQSRGRDVENGITMEYLTALYNEYDHFIKNISNTIPVVRVDWDQFRSVEEMAAAIEREYLNASFIRNVKWAPTQM